MFLKDALLINGYVPKLKMVGLRLGTDRPDQFDEERGEWTLESYFKVTKGYTVLRTCFGNRKVMIANGDQPVSGRWQMIFVKS